MRVAMKTSVLVILALASVIPSIIALPADTKKNIDAFINNILRCRDIPGMNLAVVKDGRVLWTDGYGMREVNKTAPVTSSTYFGIASLSKAFAATLLGKVLSDKNIWYDEPVRRVLGEDFHFSDAYRSKHATFRDLLAHKMGLPPYNYVRFQGGFDRKTLAKKMYLFEATLGFRTVYRYNNLIYGLISYISEKAGGDTWENLLTKHIFKPLNMTRTTFTHTVNFDDVIYATPYVSYSDGDSKKTRPVSMQFHSEWGKLGGSGSVFSTADDMAKWLLFQLGNGTDQRGQRVVDERYFKETHKMSFSMGRQSDSDLSTRPNIPVTYTVNNYGMGWRIGYYRGYDMIMHTGGSWGYHSLLTLIPSLKIGIYTSVNKGDSPWKTRRPVHMYILDLLMGVEPWLNLTTACTFPEPWIQTKTQQNAAPIKKNATTQRALSGYVGIYGNFAFGNLSFVLEGEKLQLKYGEIGRWTLHPLEQKDEFYGEGSEVIWPAALTQIIFKDKKGSGNIDTVVIPKFERSNPPEFTRGLKMSDAPPPPRECPDPRQPTSSQSSLSSTNLIPVFLCIAFINCFVSMHLQYC